MAIVMRVVFRDLVPFSEHLFYMGKSVLRHLRFVIRFRKFEKKKDPSTSGYIGQNQEAADFDDHVMLVGVLK